MMATIFKRTPEQLSERRIDPWHYQPRFERQINKIKDNLGALPLEAVIDSKRGVASGATPLGANYLEKGRVKFYRTSEVEEMFLQAEEAVFINDEDDEKLKRSRLVDGDVLLTITGAKFGKSAVVSAKHLPANISQHSVRFKPDPKKVDAYFLVAYLNSKTGQVAIWKEAYGATRPAIDFPSVRSLAVPKVLPLAQKYIGDKVRQAEQLRVWAKRLNSVLQSQIHSVFKGDPKPEKRIGKVISIQQLSSLRLEAEYYGDLELWAELEIKNSPFPNKPLGELSSRIKDGPGGWAVSTSDYRPSGIPVIRSVNLIDGRCELEDCVFISKEKHNDLRSHQVKPGGLLLSVRGTIGRAAVFDSEKYSTASLNAAVVTIDCKPTINPYYLAAFLNSEVGRIQSNRIANGAVQLNMNLKETASNLIVIPPINLQETIAATFLSKNRAIILANLLIQSAKTLVEALIEGQLTEQQLIQAQQALEDGDNSLDQAILSKLSAEGYAIEGATPLFSDVDELYSLLEEAAQAEAEE
ncbi:MULTISPECIES: restriction endonuclease subunit S [Escherichia]|uniref:restriction endonuclease subunit S n=2 Tax=Enterobacteriaceae TaxID=543 RepID=UPI0002FE512C|nr:MULTISPECIES: restriction endonuclease subunit S [Escherichia]